MTLNCEEIKTGSDEIHRRSKQDEMKLGEDHNRMKRERRSKQDDVKLRGDQNRMR